MKLFKKLAAALVATMLVMTMIGGGAISAFANGSGTTTKYYTVEIKGNDQDKGKHKYDAYQIFKGDVSGGSGSPLVLSNIEWGTSMTDAGKTALAGSGTTAAKYAATVQNTAEQAEEILAKLEGKLGTAYTSGVDSLKLEAGYYLIKEADGFPNGTEKSGTIPYSATKFILAVVGPTNVTVKSSVPSVEKKVQDNNDSTSGTTVLTDLQDSADYDIGDEIPYTVTATIGDGIDNYSAYSIQFVDDMSKGLTLKNADGEWKIVIPAVAATSGSAAIPEQDVTNLFELTSTSGTKTSGSTAWKWATNNVKPSGTILNAGMNVVLTYKCVLNADAVVGAKGNLNEVRLNFDNNPNSCGKGKPSGTTPWDKNIVFTYKAIFDKVQPDGSGTKKPLEGADFILYKKVNGDWVPVNELHGSGTGITNPGKKKTTSGTRFEFTGLDDGIYMLRESVTPDGFNTLPDQYFTITAEHSEEADTPVLTMLSGTGFSGSKITLESSTATCILKAEVENNKGTVLPSTGGIGTTIFYVLGAILVLGGGVLLVTRRRMAA